MPMEPNVLRMLAANARFLLFTNHERRRLEGNARQIRCIAPVRESSHDLTYLLGELIGELNNGHTYVGGGERPDTPRIELGLLGAESSRDPATRAYRIERILPGENWDKKTRSPLTDVGVDVKPGDYILAINNTPVSSLPNLYDALIGTAEQTSDPAREFQADRCRCARRDCCAH